MGDAPVPEGRKIVAPGERKRARRNGRGNRRAPEGRKTLELWAPLDRGRARPGGTEDSSSGRAQASPEKRARQPTSPEGPTEKRHATGFCRPSGAWSIHTRLSGGSLRSPPSTFFRPLRGRINHTRPLSSGPFGATSINPVYLLAAPPGPHRPTPDPAASGPSGAMCVPEIWAPRRAGLTTNIETARSRRPRRPGRRS